MATLSIAQARRIALAAQGFGRPRPSGPVTMRHVRQVIDRVAQFQIDSVNVAVRAHYMPLFSRLGGYDPALLDRASGRAPRRLFEYWGHAACLLDVGLQPAFRMAMRSRAARERQALSRILEVKPDLLDRVLADVAQGGPLSARQIENAEERRKEHWGWNWSEAKHVLEYLFDSGTVAVANRNSAFERRYDLAERVLPAAVLAHPDPTDQESYDMLLARAASALGVADLKALAEYFYLRAPAVRDAVERLQASGVLEPVRVVGLPQQFWLAADARRPRRLTGQALIAPFDTLVHHRPRVLQLFDVHYRIGIYTPAAQRDYGYYVYLFLADDELVGRVDLKADRARGLLQVQSAWVEPGAEPRRAEVASRLRDELRLMGEWLGLDAVAVADRGTLARELAALC
ncbi:MAG: crosslink repair DNA glycosylase YcaQ family protein [Micropruina sp.]|uniref:winged helix-turn-helix domain-containing protein n=1 Tax=Micropruina sp. TaxID=2737536 RepID=UPI0039E25A9C